MSTIVRTVPRAALFTLTRTELKLFLRERAGVFWGVVFPLILLILFGSIPDNRHPSKSLGGLSLITVYVPILIAFVLAILALNALPSALAGYREKGILRRLSTTPLPPSSVLAAQLVINAAVAAIALILLVGVGRIAFAVDLPRQAPGFVAAAVLSGAALFAIGLTIAAVAPSGRMALVIGQILFYPLMFFAGLWVPREAMADTVRQISDFTPLGAAVQALTDSMQGRWPQPLHLAVLAAYAVVFALAAVKWFRWDD